MSRSSVVSAFRRTTIVRRTVIVSLFSLLLGAAAEAAVTDYIGKTVVEVRLQLKGAALQNAELVEIIETRTGAPLAMVDVRESMAHLFGLGLYQDVQVDAVASRRRGRPDLQPLSRAACPAHRFRGIAGPVRKRSEAHRRRAARRVAARSRARPRPWRRCRPLYRDRGYPKAEIAVRAGDDADSSNVSMVFSIRPGARARIGAIEVQGAPREPAPQVLSALDLRVGDEYDGVDLDARLIRYANELRTAGLLRGACGAASSIRRRRCGRESRAEHRAGTARGDRVPGRSARSRRSRSPRADRARAFGRRRPARGLEVRHRAPLPRARLLQSARRLSAQRRRAAEVRGRMPACCA